MSILKTATTTVFCLALVGVVFSPAANASDWNRKTTMTFSGPVEIPGVHLKGWGVLPAGTYVFKILDSLSDRHIVQIFNADETQVYATILAIPNYRLKATDKTVVTFRERPAGQPEALRAWFYPGRNWGEEFVYPRAKAIALAKLTNTAVLYTPAEIPVEVVVPIMSANEPLVMEMRRVPIMAIQPTGEEVAVAAVVTPPPAAELQADTAPTVVAAASLPKTASPMPLIALLGFLALGGALTLGLARRRVL
jgi:LPXTG-motif cell wall-anchored protein